MKLPMTGTLLSSQMEIFLFMLSGRLFLVVSMSTAPFVSRSAIISSAETDGLPAITFSPLSFRAARHLPPMSFEYSSVASAIRVILSIFLISVIFRILSEMMDTASLSSSCRTPWNSTRLAISWISLKASALAFGGCDIVPRLSALVRRLASSAVFMAGIIR